MIPNATSHGVTYHVQKLVSVRGDAVSQLQPGHARVQPEKLVRLGQGARKQPKR
jgi:hypothetical protein